MTKAITTATTDLRIFIVEAFFCDLGASKVHFESEDPTIANSKVLFFKGNSGGLFLGLRDGGDLEQLFLPGT